MTVAAPSATALVAVLLTCAAACLFLIVVIARLPEPEDAVQEGWTKRPYASLAAKGPVCVVLLLSAGSALLAVEQARSQWPLLLVLAGPVCALVTCDLYTTWLPLRATRWCWVLSAAALACCLLATPRDAWTVGLRSTLAAAVTTLFFWTCWRLTGALGFGDVRLVGMLSAGAALDSWTLVGATLLAGTTVGAVASIVVALLRRRRPHPMGTTIPYGPALWSGIWLAFLAT